MIRRLTRWFALVLPPLWALLAFALIYLGMTGVLAWFFWQLRRSDPTAAILSADLFVPRDVIIGFGLVTYGVFRVTAFHPVFLPTYRRWLEQIPWTYHRDLPGGPIHLVAQDGLLVIAAILLSYGSPRMQFLAVPLFAAAYLIALGTTFWATGPRWPTYVVGFGLGLIVLLKGQPAAMLVVSGVLYGLAYVGLRQALKRFPWEIPQAWEHFPLRLQASRDERRQSTLGWPFDLLQPKPPTLAISRLDGLLLSLLGGWWTIVLASLPSAPNDRLEASVVPLLLVTPACVLIRAGLYCWTHWPPISLLGRIRTLRWIIPGYDKVFLAPLCTLLVGPGLVAVLARFGVPLNYSAPIAVAAMLFVTFNMGPTLCNWRLTGYSRITPLLNRNSQEFVNL
jgi:hypothetical protein